MAKPIVRTFNQSKDYLINAFPRVVKKLGMRMIGSNRELGMLSFGQEGKTIFHAHVVEQKNESTRVEVAPGLPFMKDRSQSEMPTSTIEKVMDKLNNSLTCKSN